MNKGVAMIDWRGVSLSVVVVLAAHAEAGARDVYFKVGEIRFKVGDQSYQYTLRSDSTLPSINEAGVELRLVYEGPLVGCCSHVRVDIVLRDAEQLRAPGSYGNDAIEVFDVEWLPSPNSTGERWLLNPAMHQDQCVFTLTRLGAAGVKGSATCTGRTVPIRDVEFAATP